MVRYVPEHKEGTRSKIVQAAAVLFREKGVDATTLPEIMQAAGLTTVGGFYRHFESKNELFMVALEQAMARTLNMMRSQSFLFEGLEWIDKTAAVYLHPEHRTNVGGGCPLPALTAEVARQGNEPRRRYEAALEMIVDEIEAKMPKGDPGVSRQRAWGFLATLVGGLLLSRGVESDEMASEILAACRGAAPPDH